MDVIMSVSDRISVTVQAPAEAAAAIEQHREFIAGETLADDLALGEVADGTPGAVGEGTEIKVTVRRR